MSDKEKKENKKALIIISIIIIILAIIVFGLLLGSGKLQENILIGRINNLVKNTDLSVDRIDIEDIKTSGNYGKVEKAIKTYLNDFATEIQEIYVIANDERMSNMLSIENYKEDGPEFEKTFEFVNYSLNRLEESSSKSIELMKEEQIMEYINAYNLEEKYVDLYKKLMLDENTGKELKESQKELDNATLKLTSDLEAAKDVLGFLKENKGNWTVSDNSIVFTTSSLVNQYNELIKKLEE